MRRRRVILASWLFVIVLLLSAFYPTIFLYGSITAPNTLGVFMLIPLSGLLLGRRALTFIFGLCTCNDYYHLSWRSVSGYLRAGEWAPWRRPEAYVAIIVGIILNTVLLRLTLRDAERSASEALAHCTDAGADQPRASCQPLPA